MMFLINIGLNNNPAKNHKELVNQIENTGFEIQEYVYSVGEYDNNYEPTFVALLIDNTGVIADAPNVCAAIDNLSDELNQECIPICFGDLSGFMCGKNPKKYQFDNKFMLTINERNEHIGYEVEDKKVYASFNSLLNTMDFWKGFLSA
jgi:hypothetical protein